MYRCATACLLASILASGSAAAATWTWADRPFDGTWVIQPELTTFDLRSPVLSLGQGKFKRSDCRTDAIDVPADGRSHDVKGEPWFNSMSVRVIDRRHVAIEERLAGRKIWAGTYALSADGRSLMVDFEDDRPATAVHGALEYSRQGEALAGMHALSGTWIPKKILHLSASGSSISISTQPSAAAVPNGPDWNATFSWSRADGSGAEGKLDNREYPLRGYLPGGTVSVARISQDTLRINQNRNGDLVELTNAEVSADGQTMTLSDIDWFCQAKTVFVLKKQSLQQAADSHIRPQ